MKIEEIIISCSRAILIVASVIGLVGWLYLTLIILAYFGLRRNAEDLFVLFFPFVYLSLTIYACLRVNARRKLILLGITLNLPPAAFLTYHFIKEGEFLFASRLCLAFIGVWALLCVGYAWFRPPDARRVIQQGRKPGP
jgi:hypothetical protein